MIRTVVESPFGRNVDGSKCTPEQYARNIRYLNRALTHSIRRGDEAPYASHRFYPGLLDDTEPADRALGMKMGLVWSEAAQRVAVYQDHGITEGMQQALAQHAERGIEVVFRMIGIEPDLEGTCPHCLEALKDDEAVEGPKGDLWHQACLDGWREE